MIIFRMFVIPILMSIVFTFITYNVLDWIAYKNIKKRFYNYRDKIFIADFSKRFAIRFTISKIGVEVVDYCKRSVFFKSKYHALLEEISTTLEQISYE